MNEFDKLLWVYRAVFKQANAGGGTIQVNIIARERTVLLSGTIGNNDYAANRTESVALRDEDDNQILALMSNGAVDNTQFPFPVSDHSAVASGDGHELQKRVVMGKGEYIIARAFTLDQNEEFTLSVRALVESSKPSVTTTGSAGTVTSVLTYDKVI